MMRLLHGRDLHFRPVWQCLLKLHNKIFRFLQRELVEGNMGEPLEKLSSLPGRRLFQTRHQNRDLLSDVTGEKLGGSGLSVE